MSGSFLSLSEDSFCETLSSAGDVAMAPPPSKLHPNGSALLMRLVTEDTPPDMLAGSMDLRVTLPNGTTVKMSVERSTPMMDLLIQITTANKVSPGDYILQVLGDKGILPYKPSTPIGALDTLSIRVVPRHSTANNNPHNNSLNRKRIPLINSLIGQQQPFEQTFRLQVHLPRNQLFVARLSPRTSLAEILVHVCEEKNLDPNKYELRHPVNTDQSLQLSLCLADYKITEIVVVPRGSRPSTELSSSDIPALQRSNSEQRNGSSATSSGSGSGGVLSILKRNKSDGNREGSLSGDSLGGRSSSPARSDESLSRSISPPAGKIMDRQNMAPPPPVRHRKGRAPKPPAAPSVPAVEVEEATSKPAEPKRTTALVISHSRNSSDSSGYHEASVLSDTPDNLNGHSTSPSDTINRKSSKAAPTTSSTAAGAAAGKLQYSLSMSDVSKTDAPGRMSNATSTSSLSNKKKKAPAPPPAVPPPSALPSRSSSRSSSVLEPSESAEKLPAKDLPSPAEPVTVRTENGHMDNGSHCEEDLEVQVQSMDVGKAESEYASDDEDDLDSAFQSVTDVLEKQLEAEERLLKQQKIVQVENEEDLSKTPSPAPQVEEVEENIKEEDPRLVQERLGKEKLLKELEVKKALHEKQRMEIERLQKEQQELELALKKFEMESQNEEKKQDSIPISPEPSDIPDWEYKLPAPPTAFRDSKETATPSNTPEEEKRRLSFDLKPTEVEKETPRIEIVPPLPDIIIQQPDILIDQQESVHEEEEVKRFVEEEDPEMRPKPPAIVDVTIKPAVVSELPKRRSASPPRVTIMPLRAAHSLCSLVYDHRDNKQQDEEEVPRRGSGSDSDSDRVLSPLRKTTSVDDVSKSTAQNEAPVQEEEQRLQQLQQQLLTWQKQLITNQSVLQEHVDMPLQSLQVLREILPQMKQKLEEDAMNGTSTTTITETITSRSSTLPRGVRSLDMEVSDPTVYRGSNTLERRTVVTSSSSSSVQQRFRPPTINLGTWSERPKSEIALKQDSDYRVGVGQLQARAAPIVRQAEPKPKETLHLLGSNGDPVTRSNSWRVLQQPPYKSSVTIHSLATEQVPKVRASNKPTVILRQNPPASYHQSLEQQSEFAAPKGPQKRYTTLVGLNGAPQPTQVTQQHQPVVIAQVAPSVKGFAAPSSNAPVKISPLTAPKPTPVPPPPPPAQQLQQPMVIRPTAPPKKKLPVQTSEAPRDQLMDAIKNFGGRSNLRRVRSTQ
ncbi:uncharacterized protein LOC132192632 isoform X4 [Neocloeon triangulifer]|uniref:uncharacterized protein LOC132192632 isoform X4 n=1 Tax=Neocloeon triangulifer TaxID=2078957 RepID=UPI00286F0FC4|nr:uncharacterized protein LOC132192632 isoform X4 [Neocloeon triangulifer]